MEADKAPEGVRELPHIEREVDFPFRSALIEEVFQKGICEQVSLSILVQHKCVPL